MKLSKTSEYALRILSFMAMDESGLYTARYLYKKLEIPQPYLRRLLTDLTKSGIISSIQGKNGGYIFSKGIGDIYFSDIIDAVEGEQVYNACIFGFDECAFEAPCAMHDRWEEVKSKTLEVLSTTSLADIKNESAMRI